MQEESTELMQVLTDYEPISSTGGALSKIASLKKEREQLMVQLGWAPVRDDSGTWLECATTTAGGLECATTPPGVI